ncbi:MAG: UPF0175 family protein [Candidatus Korarchaeota archaeon]|nr:UPF0175 family protein [Candidatus Korarchaeota archaeon]NIU82336.1 UPF0175 family protein [Candidatus Thorarchaeota archaeon]NIW12820.1 UPF0175 family protein [Candidatus Thorarchaeota archaeon]NIW51013.1 UPF0175 family protein [Candidatus Korarchaeota archaeon]
MEKKIVIKLPSMIKLPDDEIESRVKKELALRLYQQDILSFGQARKLAQVSKWEFIAFLKNEQSGIPYTEAELEVGLKTIEELD